MEALAKLEAERGNPEYLPDAERELRCTKAPESVRGDGQRSRRASSEMCTFLILNISSLQLIPVNMIAYRQQYGSVNPARIIAPAIVATAVSTAVAVVYCKMKNRRRRT